MAGCGYSVAIEIENEKEELNEFSIGVDLAITNIDELDTKNINKTHNVKTLSKILKRKQRQCSRKYEMNKRGECYQKTKNIAELEKNIERLHSKLAHIRAGSHRINANVGLLVIEIKMLVTTLRSMV